MDNVYFFIEQYKKSPCCTTSNNTGLTEVSKYISLQKNAQKNKIIDNTMYKKIIKVQK